MLSVRRFASFFPSLLPCAALSFGLLPRVASAQAADTPFFAEDLTRERLGAIRNLDEQSAPLAHMAPDGHMVITGAETDVWVQPGKYIELLPNLNIVGFTPSTLAIYEGSTRIASYGLEKTSLPLLRVDPPTGEVHRKVVRVAVFDAMGKPRTLMQCTVRSNIVNPTNAALNSRRRGEQCALQIADRQTLSSAFLYLGDIYMGRVAVDAGEIQMDERRLPPGTYSCQMVAQNTDGILLPGMSSEYIVPNRYAITCADTSPTILIKEHDDPKVTVTVKRASGPNIVKTRVYIAGNFVAEKEEAEFTLALPVHDVPSGGNTIEVIGVGPDDTTYPVESIAVKIKNEPWEFRMRGTPEYDRIAENLPKIKEKERLVGYWMARAANTPDMVHTGTTKSYYSTYSEITEHYVPSNRSEYQANAEKEFIHMTQLQLETARLYHKLQMRSRAKNMLARVLHELAGTDKQDGVEAAAELDKLRSERATSL